MRAPAPGVYDGIPDTEYHSWDACSSSILKEFARSDAHARHRMLQPSKQTQAQAFGSATHVRLLQPRLFDAQYIERPFTSNRRLKRDEQEWAAFDRESSGKTILTAQEWEDIGDIRTAVYEHSLAAQLLHAPGRTELSLVWDDFATGLRCKARIDKLLQHAGWTICLDVKTTVDGSTEGFRRAIANYDYHIQAGHYMNGLDALGGLLERRWWWLAIEKVAPFASAVYEIESEDLKLGRAKAREYLGRWAECKKTGEWPGYNPGLMVAGLPAWRRAREDYFETEDMIDG